MMIKWMGWLKRQPSVDCHCFKWTHFFSRTKFQRSKLRLVKMKVSSMMNWKKARQLVIWLATFFFLLSFFLSFFLKYFFLFSVQHWAEILPRDISMHQKRWWNDKNAEIEWAADEKHPSESNRQFNSSSIVEYKNPGE